MVTDDQHHNHIRESEIWHLCLLLKQKQLSTFPFEQSHRSQLVQWAMMVSVNQYMNMQFRIKIAKTYALGVGGLSYVLAV